MITRNMNDIYEMIKQCFIRLKYMFSATDSDDVDAGEQTVYACSGSPLILRCGENSTHQQNTVILDLNNP